MLIIVCIIFSFIVSALLPITRYPSTNTPPSVRIYHFMDYGESINSIIIFGGYQGIQHYYNDVWKYDFNAGIYTSLVHTNDVVPGNTY